MCVYCKYRICTVRLQGASDNADLSFQFRAGADLRADHAADQAADPVRRAAPRRRTAQHPARELRISVITTKRAYEDLERDGFILTQQGRGSFVAEQNPALLREEHLKKVEDCLQGAVDAARLGGIGYDEVAETLRLLWEG